MSQPAAMRIGKYELVEQLGEGAMGKVYRAFDPVLHRDVAIKVMSLGIASDPHLRDRFLREARAAGSLQHPNIVTIFDFGEADGHLYIAMELVEGNDLAHISRGLVALSLDAKLDVVIQLLRGLAYAHGRGIVHRDVKPANIRVTPDGRVKILDFGIAHLAGSEITSSGMVMGTPDYMAPEQVKGQTVGPAADLFAVGAVLYELLTHRKPFHGDTVHTIMYRVVTEQPAPLARHNPSVPTELQTIVETALAKDPEDRYQNAEIMAAALAGARRILSERDSAATIVVPATPIPARRRGARWLAFGSSALIVGAVAAIAWLQSRPPVSGDGATTLAPLPVADSVPALAITPAVPPTSSDSLAQSQPRDSSATVAASASPPSADSNAARLPAGSAAAGVRADRVRAMAARARARTAGASPAALRVGDALARRAAALADSGNADSARTLLALARARWLAAARTPGAQPPAPSVTDSRLELENAVRQLESAISSRSIGALRQVYPGISTLDATRWERFFASVRDLRAQFQLTQSEIQGAVARVRLGGSYRYEDARTNRPEHRQVALSAVLERTDAGWRWTSIGGVPGQGTTVR